MPEASRPLFRVPISRRNTRLSRRLIAYMVAFSSALTLVITAYQLYRDYDRDLRLIESRMRQVQYVHLNSLVDTLWATNTKKLQIHLDGILRLPDMQYVAVKEGERLWASAGTFQSDNVISREFPMNYVHRGRTLEIGTLSVVATLDGVYQRLIDKTLIILLSNGIKTFLVAGFMLLIFQYLVTRHLDTLARYARGLNLDNLPNPLWLKRKSKGRRAPDELDEVVAAINDMRVDMEESFEALRENEERLRAVVDSIVVGVITIDETGVVQSFNRGAESMFGYAPAEVVGENVTILMPEVHRSGHGSYIANYLRTGEAKIIGIGREVEGRRKDGSIFPMELEIGAMVVGGQRMFAGIVKDITERKRAEEALRESEASLANAQRIAHVGNWDWNIETSELGWSDEIYRIFGLKPQQFGATYGAFLNTVHAEDRALVQEAVNRSLEEKTPYAIDHRIVLPDGTVRVVHEEGEVSFDTNGKPVRMTGTVQDITERRRADEALRQSEERFRTLAGSSSQGILVHRHYRPLYANRTLVEMFGYDNVEEILALGLVDTLFAPDERSRMLGYHEDRLRGDPAPNDYEFKGLRKDGSEIWLNNRAFRIDWGDGPAICTTLFDVTERKRAEEALRESRARLIDAIESISEGFVLFDAEERLVLCNSKYREFYPMIADVLTPGRHLEDIVRAAAERGQIIQAIDNVDGWIRERLIQYRSARGTQEQHLSDGRWLVASEHRTREGGIVGVRTDFTESKRAGEALRASEERFRLLLDSTGEAIYGLDTDGNCTFANPACARYLGYGDPADLLGRNMHDLIHHTRPDGTPYPREACRIYQAFVEGESTHVEDEVLWRSDGTSFPVEYRSFPVRRAGEMVGAVVTFVDITERKETQAQLIQASKLATLGEMASGIAHEINQPLSVIGMAAEFSLLSMEDGEFDHDLVRKKLETISGQKERMAEIIDHMRLFSRQDEADLEPFDPLVSVSRALGLIAKPLKAAGIELEENLPASCRTVLGRLSRLEQVVLNLLTNARDAVLGKSAGSAGGAYVSKVCVSMVDDKRRKTVVISVSDNGGGIPEEALKRIFDPFFTTKTEGEGTGLGLSISYSIVDGMGGRIEAKNTGGGAMFRITLPVSADQPAAVDSPPKRRRAKPRPGKTASTLPRIIFVDDEKDIVEEVAEYLMYEGYDVATAGNGWEALKLHQSRPADMVITDWLMPGMGGDELIRRLRQTYPDLPIMVITGHTTFGEDQDIVAHGASVVLKKPIDLHELTERMRQMVGP